MPKLITITMLSVSLLVSGCASIVSDSQWPVSVNSTPDKAEFVIRNENGVAIAGGTTPQTVMLPSGAGYFDGETYIIQFTKGGFASRNVTVNSSINGWYWGNLLFGGLVGFFIVDPATGAMWKLPTNAYADLGREIASK